jgi:hypothetical protein
MLAPPTAIYALGPGLAKKYVDMTFFRVESVASFQLQQYLYITVLSKIILFISLTTPKISSKIQISEACDL